jgi:hypothetical protein
MANSSSRKGNRFHYAATLLGALAVLALTPATANATDDQPGNSAGGQCTHTDANGFTIPMDDGQDILVDAKIVSCRNGKTTTTTAPKRNVSQARTPALADAPILSVKP